MGTLIFLKLSHRSTESLLTLWASGFNPCPALDKSEWVRSTSFLPWTRTIARYQKRARAPPPHPDLERSAQGCAAPPASSWRRIVGWFAYRGFGRLPGEKIARPLCNEHIRRPPTADRLQPDPRPPAPPAVHRPVWCAHRPIPPSCSTQPRDVCGRQYNAPVPSVDKRVDRARYDNTWSLPRTPDLSLV